MNSANINTYQAVRKPAPTQQTYRIADKRQAPQSTTAAPSAPVVRVRRPVAAPASVAGKDYPIAGFANKAQFERFSYSLYAKLAEKGYPDVEAIMMGSTVTGMNSETKKPFGPHSDHDIALVSRDLHKRAVEIGMQLRSQGDRTEPLKPRQEKFLNLNSVTAAMGKIARRPVKFMVYQLPEHTGTRPTFPMPRPVDHTSKHAGFNWSQPTVAAPRAQPQAPVSVSVEKNPDAWPTL